MLKLGNSNINKAYLGSTEIKKMYLGNTVVFDKTATEIMHLSYNSTTSLNFLVATTSGDDWEIDWGDGVWEQYASSGSYITKAFGSSTAGVARVRSATGRELSDLRRMQSNMGTWSFDVADLCATEHVYFNGNSMTLIGNVGDIKADYYARFIGSSMALIGDAGDIKATYYADFRGTSMALTYTTQTWTTIPTNTFLLSLATGHLTTSELSQMLVDMDASGITGAATLDFRYNNGAPNAAGITAADNLRAKGYTVLTN